MPARKKPVINLESSMKEISPEIKIPELDSAPEIAQMKKTLEGENLSEIVKMANNNVPVIKPN